MHEILICRMVGSSSLRNLLLEFDCVALIALLKQAEQGYSTLTANHSETFSSSD